MERRIGIGWFGILFLVVFASQSVSADMHLKAVGAIDFSPDSRSSLLHAWTMLFGMEG